jgi:hypothetical protein
VSPKEARLANQTGVLAGSIKQGVYDDQLAPDPKDGRRMRVRRDEKAARTR